MGSSPSAALYWGFDLGTMIDPETWDDLKPSWMGGYDSELEEEAPERDWEEVYAERSTGWTEVPFPENKEKTEEAFRQLPEYQAWSASIDAVRECVKISNCVITSYGCMDDPTTYVAIRASVQRVVDYGDVELQPLVVDPAWEQQLLDFMKLMDLKIPAGAKPTWHMCCSYGRAVAGLQRCTCREDFSVADLQLWLRPAVIWVTKWT